MEYLSVEHQNGIAIITLDQPGEKLNKLTEQLIEEFSELLDDIEQDDSVKGAVLISGKKDSFVAGADINMLKSKNTAEEVEELSRTGNQLIRRMEQCPKPFVAAIHGACMGGGMEISMACDYRVVSNHSDTKMGQPEVKLGLLPGGGGTQRLPRIIGIQKALTYMLTGKNIYPYKAKKIGWADELTHQHAILKAAQKAVHNIVDGSLQTNKDKRSLFEKLLEGNPIGRKVIFSQARKRSKKQSKGNYPAPEKIIDCVEFGYRHGIDKGLEYESKQFGELSQTPESKELVNLFFAMTSAKKNPQKEMAHDISKIGVLGAGLMGSGIAEVSAENDLRVLLKDQTMEQAAGGEQTIYKNLDKKRKKHIISEFERDQTASKVTGVDSYDGFDGVDLVIEAVFEDLDLKRKVLAETEANTPESTIYASNTSSLPISEIARDAERPKQVLGMHYFSPVQKMPLLEIIKTDQTADWVTAAAYEVGVTQGKHVIVVNDGPGFYTTRILAPFMNEALVLLEEGADIEQLDKTMKGFGFPVGPVTLLDEVGIDVGAHVTEVLSDLFSERGIEPSAKASELFEDGYKGRKNKQGFYQYAEENGNTKKQGINKEIYRYFGGSDRTTMDPDIISTRMLLTMVNEAAWCLQEEILQHPTDGDLGAVLGLGFPPFLGGPFRYIDREGINNILQKLEELENQHGNRFTPAPILQDYAKKQKLFHTD